MSGRVRRPPPPPVDYPAAVLHVLGVFSRENRTYRDFKLFFDQLRYLGVHPSIAASSAVKLLELDRESKRAVVDEKKAGA